LKGADLTAFVERSVNVLVRVYLLSFACAKESNKEKHTGNDLQPLPDAVIELQYYC
jgi:hypothetical protein